MKRNDRCKVFYGSGASSLEEAVNKWFEAMPGIGGSITHMLQSQSSGYITLSIFYDKESYERSKRPENEL
jgi:hypothetical protein